MISSNIPSNLGNLIAPFLPAGQRPVGQETAANRNSTFKPVEQAAKTADTCVQLQYRKQQEKEKEKQQEREQAEPQTAEPDPNEQSLAPETPSTRLAQRFSSGGSGRTGRHFDETV